MSRTRSLGSQEDIQAGRDAAEGTPSRNFLSIPDTKTPWFLLDMDFSDGFVHWVQFPNGRKQKVVCLGDPETSGGFAPDQCPICEYMLAGYNRAKEMRNEGETKKADALKNEMSDIRAKYEAHFIAVRGERLQTKNAKGKKIISADFDMSDEDSEVEVGVLSLSHAQFTGLTDMAENDEPAYVKSGMDLCNRALWSEKKQTQGKQRKYKEVKWSASPRRIETPEVEIPEDLVVSDDFETDPEMTEKVHALLTGESSEAIDYDEEVDVESNSEEESDDSDLDDVGEGEEEYAEDEGEEEAGEEEAGEEEGEDEGTEYVSEEEEAGEEEGDEPPSDVGFEDDIPWPTDDDDPQPEPQKQKPRSTTGTAKKQTTGVRKKTDTKSGKAGTGRRSASGSGKAKPTARGTGKARAGTTRPKSGTTARSKKQTGTASKATGKRRTTSGKAKF